MNRCGSFPLLSAPHSLFSNWIDLKRSEKIPGTPSWRWGEWYKSVALQPRRAKTDWSGCCQMAVQGAFWLTKLLSLNLNFSFINRISLLLISSSYPIALMRLGGARSRPGIKLDTSWMAVRHANHYSKQAVYIYQVWLKSNQPVSSDGGTNKQIYKQTNKQSRKLKSTRIVIFLYETDKKKQNNTV